MKRTISDNESCLCGSGNTYSTCCQKVHLDHAAASTAEELMRSRYTAFALEKSSHILKTWVENKRPKALNFDDHPVTWIHLTINSSKDGQPENSTGQVDFTSTYIENGQLCTLSEISNFKKIDSLWYYVDGVCDVSKRKLERNRPCPCGSGKKFKRCCVRK